MCDIVQRVMQGGARVCQRLGAGVLLLLPLAAAAEARVAWHAPADCPSPAAAEAEIAQLVQADLRTFPNELFASVEISHSSDQELRARVAVRAGGRVREHVLSDTSCVALTRAAALVVALAFEPAKEPAPSPRRIPERTSDPSPTPPLEPPLVTQTPTAAANTSAAPKPEPEPEPTREPTPEPEPTITTTTSDNTPVDPPSPPLKVLLGGALGLTQGILPSLSPFGAVSVALMNHDLYAALRLSYSPRQHVQLDVPQGAGGTVSLASAALEAGFLSHLPPLEIPLLAGLETGVFVARGTGPMTEADTQVVDWLAGYLSTGLAFTWNDRWRAGLHLDGLLALRRPNFALDTDAGGRFTLHQARLLSVRVYLTIELRLP
jgi:hypothetical protein